MTPHYHHTIIIPVTTSHHTYDHDLFYMLDRLRGTTQWYIMCDTENVCCVVLPDPARVRAVFLIQRALRAYWRRRRLARALAFAMGLHARLGVGSQVARLDADTVGLILGRLAI